MLHGPSSIGPQGMARRRQRNYRIEILDENGHPVRVIGSIGVARNLNPKRDLVRHIVPFNFVVVPKNLVVSHRKGESPL